MFVIVRVIGWNLGERDIRWNKDIDGDKEVVCVWDFVVSIGDEYCIVEDGWVNVIYDEVVMVLCFVVDMSIDYVDNCIDSVDRSSYSLNFCFVLLIYVIDDGGEEDDERV